MEDSRGAQQKNIDQSQVWPDVAARLSRASRGILFSVCQCVRLPVRDQAIYVVQNYDNTSLLRLILVHRLGVGLCNKYGIDIFCSLGSCDAVFLCTD